MRTNGNAQWKGPSHNENEPVKKEQNRKTDDFKELPIQCGTEMYRKVT